MPTFESVEARKKAVTLHGRHNLHAFLAVRLDETDVKISWVLLKSEFLNGVVPAGGGRQIDSVLHAYLEPPPLGTKNAIKEETKEHHHRTIIEA